MVIVLFPTIYHFINHFDSTGTFSLCDIISYLLAILSWNDAVGVLQQGGRSAAFTPLHRPNVLPPSNTKW
jgi:hypothetical protein